MNNDATCKLELATQPKWHLEPSTRYYQNKTTGWLKTIPRHSQLPSLSFLGMPASQILKVSLLGITMSFLVAVSSALSATSSSCAVVGCGVLGTSLCKQLLESPEFQTTKVVGITKTSNRHEAILEEVGESSRFSVKTADECKGEKFENVVFCAPPSGFDDYPAAVEDTVKNLWAGPSGGGCCIFTSSGGIYGFGENTQIVNEGSPVADPIKNPRSARLINAEKVVLANNGSCLRLAGLYTLTRGAHNFWVTSGKDVSGRADGLINQLHYDDAAGAVLAALSAGPSVVNSNVFLISDGHPMTREEICESALKNKHYDGVAMPKFLGTSSDPIGKIYDGSASNKALKWDPRYESFDAFMTSH